MFNPWFWTLLLAKGRFLKKGKVIHFLWMGGESTSHKRVHSTVCNWPIVYSFGGSPCRWISGVAAGGWEKSLMWILLISQKWISQVGEDLFRPFSIYLVLNICSSFSTKSSHNTEEEKTKKKKEKPNFFILILVKVDEVKGGSDKLAEKMPNVNLIRSDRI